MSRKYPICQTDPVTSCLFYVCIKINKCGSSRGFLLEPHSLIWLRGRLRSARSAPGTYMRGEGPLDSVSAAEKKVPCFKGGSHFINQYQREREKLKEGKDRSCCVAFGQETTSETIPILFLRQFFTLISAVWLVKYKNCYFSLCLDRFLTAV